MQNFTKLEVSDQSHFFFKKKKIMDIAVTVMAPRTVQMFTKAGKSTFMPKIDAISVSGKAIEAKTVRMRKMSFVAVVNSAWFVSSSASMVSFWAFSNVAICSDRPVRFRK